MQKEYFVPEAQRINLPLGILLQRLGIKGNIPPVTFDPRVMITAPLDKVGMLPTESTFFNTYGGCAVGLNSIIISLNPANIARIYFITVVTSASLSVVIRIRERNSGNALSLTSATGTILRFQNDFILTYPYQLQIDITGITGTETYTISFYGLIGDSNGSVQI